MKIKTLVIDDDPNWQMIIGKMVKTNPILELVHVCGSAMEAYGVLAEQEVDLMICDIELPDMTGLQFVKSLRQRPLVVFVTAHANYALDCYEVSPIDFLLKEFSMERFLLSIEKVRERLKIGAAEFKHEPYFFVRENLNYVQLQYREVLYMKTHENNYLQIVTADRVYTSLLSIPKMEENLKGEVFLRVHRSFLVNRTAIRMMTKNEVVLTNDDTIPIGDQYRSAFTNKLLADNLIVRSA